MSDPEGLLFVTQVAPYADGPAGRARRARPGRHGRRPGGRAAGAVRPTGRRRPRPRPVGPRPGPCARALHDRRDPVERRATGHDPRTGARRGPRPRRRSTPRPTPATAGRSTARSSAHVSTATPGRRPSTSRSSIPAIRRRSTSARSGAGTTRCTSSAISAPTPASCSACRRTLDLDAPGAKHPPFGFPLSWCFTEGAGRVFSTSLGHFPGAWESPAYLRHLSGGLAWALGTTGGRWVTITRRAGTVGPDPGAFNDDVVAPTTGSSTRAGTATSRPGRRWPRARGGASEPSRPDGARNVPGGGRTHRGRLTDLLGEPGRTVPLVAEISDGPPGPTSTGSKTDNPHAMMQEAPLQRTTGLGPGQCRRFKTLILDRQAIL